MHRGVEWRRVRVVDVCTGCHDGELGDGWWGEKSGECRHVRVGGSVVGGGGGGGSCGGGCGSDGGVGSVAGVVDGEFGDVGGGWHGWCRRDKGVGVVFSVAVVGGGCCGSVGCDGGVCDGGGGGGEVHGGGGEIFAMCVDVGVVWCVIVCGTVRRNWYGDCGQYCVIDRGAWFGI